MPRRTSRRRTSFRVRANSRSRGARKYGALFRSALRKATRVTSRAAKSSRRMLRKLSRRVRPNSRHLQANGIFKRFEILDASIDRQDRDGRRRVYRVDVEVTVPRHRIAFVGGTVRFVGVRADYERDTVGRYTLRIYIYPEGQFQMHDLRGYGAYSPYHLTDAQRKKVLAAVEKLGGKVPDIYAPLRRKGTALTPRRTSRRSSKDYATLMVLADRLSDRAMHRRRKAIAMTPLKAAREHARAAEAHHAAAAAATGAHAHEKRSHLVQAAEHERLQAQYEKDAGKLSPNYAALVRAGAQGAVRLAQSPAVRKAVTAAAPYAIEVAKTGATALQTKLQAKLRKFGGQEAAPVAVAANRRRSSRRGTSRRSPRTI